MRHGRSFSSMNKESSLEAACSAACRLANLSDRTLRTDRARPCDRIWSQPRERHDANVNPTAISVIQEQLVRSVQVKGGSYAPTGNLCWQRSLPLSLFSLLCLSSIIFLHLGGGGGNGVVTSLIARLSVSLYTEIRKVS